MTLKELNGIRQAKMEKPDGIKRSPLQGKITVRDAFSMTFFYITGNPDAGSGDIVARFTVLIPAAWEKHTEVKKVRCVMVSYIFKKRSSCMDFSIRK